LTGTGLLVVVSDSLFLISVKIAFSVAPNGVMAASYLAFISATFVSYLSSAAEDDARKLARTDLALSSSVCLLAFNSSIFVRVCNA
jgi:hypothetical protein